MYWQLRAILLTVGVISTIACIGMLSYHEMYDPKWPTHSSMNGASIAVGMIGAACFLSVGLTFINKEE